jgi:hypothetical protein
MPCVFRSSNIWQSRGRNPVHVSLVWSFICALGSFLHPHHDVCGMIAAMKNCGSSVCETPFVDKSETCSSGPAAVHTQL